MTLYSKEERELILYVKCHTFAETDEEAIEWLNYHVRHWRDEAYYA